MICLYSLPPPSSGYTCLTLSDQVHLIECCWMELLLLNCAFRSMEHEGRSLVFAPDFHLERGQWGTTGMGEVLEQVGYHRIL